MDFKNPSLFSLNFPATCDVTFLLLFQTTGPAAYSLLPSFSTFRTNFTCFNSFNSFNSRQIVIRRWKANEKTNLRGKKTLKIIQLQPKKSCHTLERLLCDLSGCSCLILHIFIVDPHSFFAAPDPAVLLNADPDLALQNCGMTFKALFYATPCVHI